MALRVHRLYPQDVPSFAETIVSRFANLYQHFQQTLGKAVAALPAPARQNLVYVYCDGLYRAYRAYDDQQRPKDAVEINAAQALTSFKEVWFFDAGQGPEAHVEYQPDYRPSIWITDPGLPFIHYHETVQPPRIAGLN